MTEIEEELRSLLMKVKKETEKAGLKLNIQKTKITVSSPITSWQIDGETTKIVTDFIFLGSNINEDGDCIHQIKRCLLHGRKALMKLDSILKAETLHSVIYSHPVAPHSSTLAWKIPWTEEPGRLQSMGSLRVGHD